MKSEIKKIDAWLKKTEMPEARLGVLACANQHAVPRVRRGSATVATLERLLAYIEGHPDGE